MKQINIFLFGNGFTEKFIAPTDNKVNYYFVNTRKIGWRKYFKKNMLNDEKNIFLITHQAWNTGWNHLLNKLKKHSNCYYYFLYAISAMEKQKYEKISNIFSARMLTYDKTDSNDYNMPWVPYPTINIPPILIKSHQFLLHFSVLCQKKKRKIPTVSINVTD